MKNRFLALLLTTAIIIGNGEVLAYAKTSCGKATIQSVGAESQSAGYTAPELDESDFSIGIGQTKQIVIPPLLYSYISDPVTGQITTEYINPTVTYTFSDAAVASISADGIVTGTAAGSTILTIDYSYEKDGQFICGAEVSLNVYVSDATLSQDKYKINISGISRSDDKTYNTGEYVTLQGTNELSDIKVSSSSRNLVINNQGSDYYFYPKRPGDYTVTFTVDGKTVSCEINVVNIAYAYNSKSVTDVGQKHWTDGSTMVAMYTGEQTTLKAKGFQTGAKIKWTSSNGAVATVSSTGNVKAKSVGYTTISATAGDYTITYKVGVSYKKAIKAMRYAVKHYNSTYSQPKRMSKDYYDCSSYVWRSYKDAGFNIGNCHTGWAPVAASLAQWCVDNNYMVYSGTVDVDNLMPGDLIFWTGAKNGRYKGIYHVDMYVGNHHSLTVAREKEFDDTITNCMVARPNSGTTTSKVMISKTKLKGQNAVKLSWSGCYHVTGYNIYRSTSEYGKYKRIATVKDAKSYTDTSVKNGKKYYYKIRPYWRAHSKTYHGKVSKIVNKKL